MIMLVTALCVKYADHPIEENLAYNVITFLTQAQLQHWNYFEKTCRHSL